MCLNVLSGGIEVIVVHPVGLHLAANAMIVRSIFKAINYYFGERSILTLGCLPNSQLPYAIYAI